MFLFVGLGNPGDEYLSHRHNIGFMAVDRIAGRHRFPPFRSKFQGDFSEGMIDGHKVCLLKPRTFMNNSGSSAAAAAKFYKIPPERFYIFHDELDLEPGKLRVKYGGGLAGHNGLRSLKAHLGTPDFWRVRLGIGHPGDKNKVSSYVLSNFSKAEEAWLAPFLDSIAGHCPDLLAGRENDFMTKIAEETRSA
ncbi:MAG: aminoacyl-tRNA hydrolase [Alphaproteobacteria bacterium]|nr:aminoacyl-tRNA hydrolase [Alphaproteobacteria bacterium]